MPIQIMVSFNFHFLLVLVLFVKSRSLLNICCSRLSLRSRSTSSYDTTMKAKNDIGSLSAVEDFQETIQSSNIKNERLPWDISINPKRKLVYMPFLKVQLEAMKEMGMTSESVDDTFISKSSSVKPARIGNMLFSNDKFRKVRLTYFDAGDNVQVKIYVDVRCC